MKLFVLDRLMLLQILPREGDITTLRIVRKLREDLSFSEEETAALKLANVDGRVQWEADADTGKDVEVGPRAQKLIVETLEQLDKQKKITLDLLPLYDKFVGE